LIDDGRVWLDRIVTGGLLEARGVVGIFPAASRGDDIVLFTDERRTTDRAVLPQMRQQGLKESTPYYLSQADWVAPEESGVQDWIALMAVTGGIRETEITAAREAAGDDYGALIIKSLADRLGEAAAEWVHRELRRDLWGYASNENLSPQEILAGDYVGIRPAPGYPPCPDHTIKRDFFALLDAEDAIGVRLTESSMMDPPSSVCAYVFAHPEAAYFSVGRLPEEQLDDYAERRGMSKSEAERWLGAFLSYEPAER
jgi:5-methyltetrahydrofolate--homocysteine methyltransferase